jgi:MHS family proline/betaine transporter-like MFS transporter
VIIGNALEWYDFIIYGFLAAMLAKHFFPATDPTVALLSSYAAFALPFIVRPFGGVLIGIYSDRAGRGAALMLIMGSMGVAMLIMTFTPTYSSIGVSATLLIVIARLLQALSAGGEFGSAASFLIENAPAHRRGIYSALYSSGPAIATLLAAIVGLIITEGMSESVQNSWGWRLPFALGLLIAPVGFYVRYKLSSSNEIERPADPPAAFSAISANITSIIIGIAICAVANASAYVFTVFAPTYVVMTLKLPVYVSFLALIVSGLTSILFIPAVGAISDAVGVKKVFLVGLVLMAVTTVPIYIWLNHSPSIMRLLISSFCFSLVGAIYAAGYPAIMAELFEPETRATCMALSYNVSSMIFGAFSLFFITLVMSKTGSPYIAGFYVSGVAAACFAIVMMRSSFRRSM